VWPAISSAAASEIGEGKDGVLRGREETDALAKGIEQLQAVTKLLGPSAKEVCARVPYANGHFSVDLADILGAIADELAGIVGNAPPTSQSAQGWRRASGRGASANARALVRDRFGAVETMSATKTAASS
jgi:hypothetical protein